MQLFVFASDHVCVQTAVFGLLIMVQVQDLPAPLYCTESAVHAYATAAYQILKIKDPVFKQSYWCHQFQSCVF